MGHLAILELLLLEERVDPNKARDNEGTPLLVACECEHKKVVERLLRDPRVDPNHPRTDMLTPIWIAAQNGDKETVEILFASDRFIDTNIVASFNGTNAFQRAIQKGHREVADLVLNYEEYSEAARIVVRRSLNRDGFPFLVSCPLLSSSAFIYSPLFISFYLNS